MRTFIAVDISDAARRLLLDLARRLDRSLDSASIGGCVRWTAPENLHLTLRFLGETSDAQRRAVDGGLASRLAAQPAFVLAVRHLGVFPNWRRPNILWVDFTGGVASLERTQALVEDAVAHAGFPAEERPFTPHLTIGRVKKDASPAVRQKFGELLQREQAATTARLDTPAAQFTVDAVTFVRSDLRPAGPVYTPLARYSLNG